MTGQKKIKTVDEVVGILGVRPRPQRVILCHGVFDIVHPGHLRHLLYAKQKADVLVAGVTADTYVVKRGHHPYVPEALRAQHLAALEMVDYVVIDPHQTSLDLLTRLQPDYFAKGYEYVESGISSATQAEADALSAYGGELLFTPGDIVHSSSALLDQHAPRIAVESLLSLMESEGLGFEDLRKAVRGLGGLRVHVVGDTIVDAYTDCTLLGAGSKSPVFSVCPQRTERFPGGAAVVARHVKAAGVAVTLSTVLGDDPDRQWVLGELCVAGIECWPAIDPTRPTTVKERLMVQGRPVLQVDRVDNGPVADYRLEWLYGQLGDPADIVILSDFRHGIFTRDSIPRFLAAVPAGSLRVADSQVSSRWGNILDFQGCDLITPNEREARFALGDQDTIVRPLGLRLRHEAKCRFLILKLGARGLIAYRGPTPEPRDFFALDSFVTHLVDPVGAGDALVAYASLALATTNNLVLASILGSLGAAVACERHGNVPVFPVDVTEKIDSLEKFARYA